MTTALRPYLWIVSLFALLIFVQASRAEIRTQAMSPTVTELKPVKAKVDTSDDEWWKGNPSSHKVTFGGLVGLGIIDSTGGFALIGTAATKILNQGFVPDLNNQVYLELELGPVFASGTTALYYSTHLRWDFVRDREWTFYSLGGLAGNITDEKLGDHWEFYPRFGIGALWQIDPRFSFRGEVSHELIALGVSFSI